jgi:hypothetical protein
MERVVCGLLQIRACNATLLPEGVRMSYRISKGACYEAS